MTREEKEIALYCLKASSDYHSEVCEECIKYPNCDHTIQDDVTETIIKALEQEPILDKIRAEIIEEKDFAYADFEQYKVDCLGVDAEYVKDEFPQDDFRYGMERAIEIIDKYKAESEDKG